MEKKKQLEVFGNAFLIVVYICCCTWMATYKKVLCCVIILLIVLKIISHKRQQPKSGEANQDSVMFSNKNPLESKQHAYIFPTLDTTEATAVPESVVQASLPSLAKEASKQHAIGVAPLHAVTEKLSRRFVPSKRKFFKKALLMHELITDKFILK